MHPSYLTFATPSPHPAVPIKPSPARISPTLHSPVTSEDTPPDPSFDLLHPSPPPRLPVSPLSFSLDPSSPLQATLVNTPPLLHPVLLDDFNISDLCDLPTPPHLQNSSSIPLPSPSTYPAPSAQLSLLTAPVPLATSPAHPHPALDLSHLPHLPHMPDLPELSNLSDFVDLYDLPDLHGLADLDLELQRSSPSVIPTTADADADAEVVVNRITDTLSFSPSLFLTQPKADVLPSPALLDFPDSASSIAANTSVPIARPPGNPSLTAQTTSPCSTTPSTHTLSLPSIITSNSSLSFLPQPTTSNVGIIASGIRPSLTNTSPSPARKARARAARAARAGHNWRRRAQAVAAQALRREGREPSRGNVDGGDGMRILGDNRVGEGEVTSVTMPMDMTYLRMGEGVECACGMRHVHIEDVAHMDLDTARQEDSEIAPVMTDAAETTTSDAVGDAKRRKSRSGSSRVRKAKRAAQEAAARTLETLLPEGARSPAAKQRFSAGAAPSRYCHVCGRCSSSIGVTACFYGMRSLCRKVVCDVCMRKYDPDWAEVVHTGAMTWQCTHCRGMCPARARCAQYRQNNEKRRRRNEERRLMKVDSGETAETVENGDGMGERVEKESKETDADGGHSPTGVGDEIVLG